MLTKIEYTANAASVAYIYMVDIFSFYVILKAHYTHAHTGMSPGNLRQHKVTYKHQLIQKWDIGKRA